MNQLSRLPPPVEPPSLARRRRPHRSGTFGVLDIGSTKIVCIIARIEGGGGALAGTPRVLGFGWQRSRGVKGGSIIDLEEAERAIRAAVGQAEEMADTQLRGAIVNLSCGQPASHEQSIQWPIAGRAVTEADLRAILGEGQRRAAQDGREIVHAFPLGFTLDATPGAEDPRGMICETLVARLHLVDAAAMALRNLGATLARCELDVEELVAAPLAAGLATLVEDEKQVGCTLIEMGGGTTSLAVFAEGHLRHTAQLPVGGWNVTNDLARGLSTPLLNAERLKTLHGGVLGGPEDHKEMLAIQPVGEDEDRIAQVPRSMVVGIIEPRLTETFELLRDRLEHAGLANEIGPQVVLTGGASQLIGVRQLAERVLGRHVRLGRPHPVLGLPEVANGPAFAGPLGLLAWAAGEGRPLLELDPTEEKRGFLNRILNWLRDKGA